MRENRSSILVIGHIPEAVAGVLGHRSRNRLQLLDDASQPQAGLETHATKWMMLCPDTMRQPL
jgi:hypothetical protein